MARPADVPLAVFSEQLRQIRVNLEFLSIASAAKDSAPSVLNHQGVQHHVAAVRKLISCAGYAKQPIWNSSYLSSAAAFEEFALRTVEAAILKRSQAAKRFGDLSVAVQDRHMEASGRLLARKHQPPQQLRGLDFFEVCRRLGTCLPDSTEFELNAEAMCLQSGILELDSTLELLRAFGYDANWDRLGADSKLQERIGVVGRNRDTGTAVKNYLLRMAQLRNRIAHTGSSSDVSAESLDEHLQVVQSVAEAVAVLVNE